MSRNRKGDAGWEFLAEAGLDLGFELGVRIIGGVFRLIFAAFEVF